MARLNLFKNYGSEFLTDLLYDIEMNSRANDKKPVTAYKPSMLKCQRECFFAFKGFEKEAGSFDYQGIGIMESGTDRHKRLQDILLQSKTIKYIDVADFIKNNQLGYLEIVGNFGNETLLYDKRYNMRFMTDGLVEYKNKVFILEIKTESMMKFDKHDEVWEEHLNQASCYSMAFGINDILFLYENRDTLAKKVIHLKVTHEMRQGVIDFINSCNIHVNENSLPPKAEGGHCRWCEYRKACRGI